MKDNAIQLSTNRPVFFQLKEYQAGVEKELDLFITAHAIINLTHESNTFMTVSEFFEILKSAFPLKTRHYEKKRPFIKPNFFGNVGSLVNLVRLMHGSYQSRGEIIRAFKNQYSCCKRSSRVILIKIRNPECKKYSILKKIQEISVKTKHEKDRRVRLFLAASYLWQ